jgi:hypothetical protein
MNRLENYLVAIAGVILSGLVSVYSKEVRGFIHAGLEGFRRARIASIKQKLAAATELHNNLQVLTAMIGLKLTRMFIFTFMATAPLMNDVIYSRPIGGWERTYFSFMMGIISSEIVIFNRQLWRSLSLPSYEVEANAKIARLLRKLQQPKT